MNDINAIEKTLDAVEVLAVAGAQIIGDGKVGMEDLPALIGLLSEVTILLDAFKGLGEAIGEVKDLDAEESIAIVAKLYEVGKEKRHLKFN